MAQKVVVHLVSDLSGQDGDETVNFALDGVSYEIDLTAEEATGLRDALAEYVKAGRRIGGRRQSGTGSTGRSKQNSDIDLNAAREWLRSQGHTVSDRGRIKGDLLDLYRKSIGA